MNIVEVKNLAKSYGDIKAVVDVSFSVERGTLFALLGVNGAGKSTTINILCTILKKNSGTATIDGYNLDDDYAMIKNEIGVVFQGSVLDGKLSVLDNLKTRGSFYALYGADLARRVDEVVELFQLEELLKRPYEKLSGGQRRRVDIARALINRPKLLFLDEPTTGLDPQNRILVWDIINKLRQDTDLSVVLTTHYMEETVNADKVVILDEGKIVAQGTPNELKNRYTKDYIKLYAKKSKDINAVLKEQKAKFVYNSNCYKISFSKFEDAKRFILKNDELLSDFELIKGDMDDVFLTVTGKQLESV